MCVAAYFLSSSSVSLRHPLPPSSTHLSDGAPKQKSAAPPQFQPQLKKKNKQQRSESLKMSQALQAHMQPVRT